MRSPFDPRQNAGMRSPFKIRIETSDHLLKESMLTSKSRSHLRV